MAAGWPDARILSGADERLLLSSTHSWTYPELPVRRRHAWGDILEPADYTAFEELSLFLQTLKITTREPVGVNHAIYLRNGWSSGYKAALPCASHAWHERRHLHGLEDVPENPVQLDSRLLRKRIDSLNAMSPKVKLASERLLGGALRQTQVDRILDACIGLEALAGDDSPGDITYKLALRTTALLAHNGADRVHEIFSAAKQIYRYRSAVAHGSPTADKKSVIDFVGDKYHASDIAEFFLEQILSTVLDEPEIGPKISNDDLILEMLLRGSRVDKTGEADTTE
ncbi:HEPN domain-containing protein [Amycolatopsis sacchari]|uniref:HEPN domain-containing protein n=1 Tax=Amycolatopsis sacchari TaxID=115433 RepID=UPI0011789351|nr:HEPN domain-containing protein [Amycolatopsis sacchari]